MSGSLSVNVNIGPSFPLAVNWKQSLASAIRESGDWFSVDRDINEENFHVRESVVRASASGSVVTEAVTVGYHDHLPKSVILTNLTSQGLRPATLMELLALCEQHPHLLRRYLIIALGSSWNRLFRRRLYPAVMPVFWEMWRTLDCDNPHKPKLFLSRRNGGDKNWTRGFRDCWHLQCFPDEMRFLAIRE